MKKRASGQILTLARLLSLCNDNPKVIGYSLSEIATWPPIKAKGVKRDSIATALIRFEKLGIVQSQVPPGDKTRLYRIKQSDWARAYIEGDSDKPWLPLTPPLTESFLESDEHRDHFDISVQESWFQIIKANANENQGQYTWRTNAFTISINGKSLSGQIFIRPYWRAEVKRLIGPGFLDYLQGLEDRGMRQGDFALPIDLKGQRFYIGGRPTQFSASHYEAQLDIRRSKGDTNIVDGLLALTRQADFNTRILDHLDAVLEGLRTQGDALESMSKNLVKIVETMTPTANGYESKDQDDSSIYR